MNRLTRFLALAASPFCYRAGYGRCLRCKLSTRFYDSFHATDWKPGRSCFPLCEHCWLILGAPEARLPFYERLVLGMWGDPGDWPAVRDAVMEETNA